VTEGDLLIRKLLTNAFFKGGRCEMKENPPTEPSLLVDCESKLIQPRRFSAGEQYFEGSKKLGSTQKSAKCKSCTSQRG
jgi:hypothetical protein